MANCIFATCIRYEPIQIIPFLKSCRNVFSGDIVLAVGAMSESALALLRQYDVRTYDLGPAVHLPDYFLAGERYKVYQKVIIDEKLRFERGLICDFSDLIFQSDPFAFDPAPYRLKVFLEDSRVQDCTVNSGWVRDVYGAEMLARLGEQWIICSGTTLGSYDGITDYLGSIINEYMLFAERCRKADIVISKLPYWRGLDQALHNYLIYTSALKGVRIVANRAGEVQTLQHQREFSFSAGGQMLNADGRVCPIVHQFNRYPNFLPALIRGNRLSDGIEVHFRCSTPGGPLGGSYSY